MSYRPNLPVGSVAASALAALLAGAAPGDSVAAGVGYLALPYAAPFDVRLLAPGGMVMNDRVAHPLSSLIPGTFANLAAAQTFFGLDPAGNQIAQSTTDETAFCCLQKALTLAKNAGGGTVKAPNGWYLMGSRTLIVPDSPSGDAATDVVKISGAGMRSTTLQWQTDTTSAPGASYAMACATRHTYCRVEIEDLHLIGPVNSSVALGVVPGNMSGLAYSSNWKTRRCYIEGFFACIDIHDDHTMTEDCILGRGSYYGTYFGPQRVGVDDLGDHHFLRTSTGFTKRAAVGISNSNQAEHCLWIDCHFYGNPYCFWREGGAPTGGYKAMTNSMSIKMQAESTGNAIWGFADAANTLDEISACAFRDFQFLQNPTYRISAESVGAALGGYFFANSFEGPNTQMGSGGNYAASTGALFAVRAFQSNTFFGPGWFDMINNASTAKPLITGDYVIFNRVIGSEQCDYEIVKLTGTVAAGDVVAWDGLGGGVMTSSSSPIGVAAVAGNAGQAIGVVTKGPVAVNKVAGAIAGNSRIALDGTAFAKVGAATNASPRAIIGTCWNGAASGDAQVNAIIRISDRVA